MRYIKNIIMINKIKADATLQSTEATPANTDTTSASTDSNSSISDIINNNSCLEIYKYGCIGSTVATIGSLGGLATLGITYLIVNSVLN
jgi:hypothetical protein